MLMLHRDRPAVQPDRRRGLAAIESWLSVAPAAPALPFTVGIARPARPARLRAPRGGAEVAGRFYRGGSFLPATAATPAPAPAANPCDGWPAWTDERWTVADRPASEIDLTAFATRPGPFAPSPDEEANAMGYSLVMAGEDPAPPRGWPYGRLVAFYEGVMAAWTKKAADEIAERGEYEAWLDSISDPHPDWHHAEMVAAAGCVVARELSRA